MYKKNTFLKELVMEGRDYACINKINGCNKVISEMRDGNGYSKTGGGKLFSNRPDLEWVDDYKDCLPYPPIGGVCKDCLAVWEESDFFVELLKHVNFGNINNDDEEIKKRLEALKVSVIELEKAAGVVRN